MSNASNQLLQKYLSAQEPPVTPAVTGNTKCEIKHNGQFGENLIVVGLYYCSLIDQFGNFAFGVIDPLVDPLGRTWRLVTSEFVAWMEERVRKAFEDPRVSDVDLGAAILKFYRVRDAIDENTQAQ